MADDKIEALRAARQAAVHVFLEKGGLGRLSLGEARYVEQNSAQIAAFCRMMRLLNWDANIQAVTKVSLDLRFNWRMNSVGSPHEQIPFLQEKKNRKKLTLDRSLSMSQCAGKYVGQSGHILFAPPNMDLEWMRDEFHLRGCRPASPFETIITMYEVDEATSSCSFVSIHPGQFVTVSRDRARERADNVSRALHVSVFTQSKDPAPSGEVKNVGYVGIEL